MITVDKSKFKRSDVTLYDKDGNVIGIAKNVLVTEDDDLCKGYRLTDSESLSLLNFRGCDRVVIASFTYNNLKREYRRMKVE